MSFSSWRRGLLVGSALRPRNVSFVTQKGRKARCDINNRPQTTANYGVGKGTIIYQRHKIRHIGNGEGNRPSGQEKRVTGQKRILLVNNPHPLTALLWLWENEHFTRRWGDDGLTCTILTCLCFHDWKCFLHFYCFYSRFF